MALDSAAQITAISQFVGSQGTPDDLVSRGEGPFFHYTDFAAFANIAMKADLWLTDARCSNDADEIEHGRLLIADLIRAHAEGGKTQEVRLLAKDLGTEMEAEAKRRDNVDAKRKEKAPDAVYVCCFCATKETGDLLSQWRGYAANGGGVAIEIDPQNFRRLAGVDCPIGLMRFWRVYYQNDEKRLKVEDVLNYWAAQPAPPDVRAQSAAATLQFFAPTFKNPMFAEEREWRLIFTPKPNGKVPPKFRPARGLIVPYFELAELVKSYPLGPQTPGVEKPPIIGIKSVRVGPGPYQKVNARSARILLDSYGFNDAEVLLSDIPFRG
jgi:hypothetical protein